MPRLRIPHTVRLFAPCLFVALPACVISDHPAVSPSAVPTALELQGEAVPNSTELERRVRYEAATLALDSGKELIARVMFDELIMESGDTTEGHFYSAAAAAAVGAVAQTEDLAKQALAGIEASEQTPWYLGELTRLIARVELARRDVHARQGLDDILARHHEARGGLGKFREIQSMIVTGILEAGDGSAEFRVFRRRPGFYRYELATGRGLIIEATDGRVAWRRDPTVEEGRVRFLDRFAGARLRSGAPFDDVLLRTGETGANMLLAGRTIRDNRDVYRLEVLVADQRETIYLDTSTFLEILRELYGDDGKVSIEVRTEYAEQDGLLFPSVLTVTSATGMNRYRFTGYDFVTPVDRWLFDAESVEKRQP